ncbi:MAG: filamentous hemagglutinin N-terminal domain-containing protein [Burkholderiales bacterium]|nr:filamentous hemagglutinin N-terminal domain-containing protein [Burkholderiales bacterium]
MTRPTKPAGAAGRRTVLRHTAWAAAWLLAVGQAQGGATTDGSVGAVQSLGGAFTVPQALGTLRGANLFHSFSRFGVAAGESATFITTDAGIRHVISRVTGGEASVVDGPVRLQAAAGSAPAFYLVNPSGIVIGPGGRFDVPAGLHLGTTPELRFADGFTWRTGSADASSLTVAAPQRFGFLAAQPAGPLQWRGGFQQLAPQQALTLAGGDITLQDTVLAAPAGQVRLQAEGSLALTEGALVLAVASPAQASGRIEVEAASLSLQGSGGRTVAGLYTETGSAGGGGLVVKVPGAVVLSRGAEISVVSAAEAGGGPVAPLQVAAGSLRLDAQGADTSLATYHIGSAAAGPALQLQVAGELTLGAGARIATSTRTEGAAGAVTVDAARILLDGGGAGGVAGISSLSSGAGVSGAVSVNAREAVRLREGGQITTATLGPGDAGTVRVSAPLVQLQGALDSVTTVSSGTLGEASGRAGEVRVEAGELSVLGTARVSADTTSLLGSAGQVVVRADRILLDGLGTMAGGLSAFAYGFVGNAGSLDVLARESLSIRDGGGILVGSLGLGDTGQIVVKTPLLRIDGRGARQLFTGIAGDALGFGAGGAVQVEADRIEILQGGMISSGTNSAADAGSVKVVADTLFVDGGGSVSGATGLSTDGSDSGRAGSISVTARQIELVAEGFISSSTLGSGAGGAIEVQAQNLTLHNAAGIYSVAGGTGDAGSITLRVGDALRLTQGGTVAANTGGAGAAGRISVQAGSLSVEGTDTASGQTSRIVSRALVGSGGRTGTIGIDVSGAVLLRDHAELSISNRATVANPAAVGSSALVLTAGSLWLQDAELSAAATGNTAASRIVVSTRGALRLERAGILTSAVEGDGGAISLRAGGTASLHDARITTSVEGRSSGNGGNIDLTAGALLMQSGFVQANTAAPLARGGEVRVEVPVLLPDGSRVSIGGAQIAAFRPGVAGGNVIQAAAPDGVGGTLAVTLPQLDLSASLARLVVPRIDFGPLGRDMCEAGPDSSFTVLGRGALPPRAGSPLRIVP